jgi:anaerobic selenocysteine-containing dehydrogenase
MLITLDGDRAVAVRGDREHPFTRGFLCHKVSRYPERVYHRDRLQFPMRRVGPKGSGQFERISWDAALDEIATRFKAIADGPYGPQAILPYSYCGTMGKIQSEGLDRRFFHRLGASLLDRTICATAGVAGYTMTIGSKQGTDPEAFSQSRYIINWGSNTAVTNMHLWVRMVEARKRHGAKIVTIDPYRSITAARSDWHLAPRPGTDAALALGLMHVLFRDGLTDEAYLRDYCLGADELRARVLSDYEPERVAEITGLDVADIERLAREYAVGHVFNVPETKQSSAEHVENVLDECGPASVIRINYGMQRHAGGGMAVRTIACLPAIIGAWRNPAGGILLSTSGTFAFNLAAVQRPDLIPPGTRTINMSQLAEALHGEFPGPPVQALYVYNSNPAAIAPDQQRVLAGLRREDLFTVVHDQFPTDSVDYADIVLPATTQLEHFDLHGSYGHQFVQVNVPAIAPIGESRCNTEVFRGLARRLGFEPELYDVTDEQLARELLWENEPTESVPPVMRGITLERLKREGASQTRSVSEGDHSQLSSREDADERSPSLTHRVRLVAPFANGGFATPSGKCELRCERLAQLGHDPLPTFIPPAESPASAPELAKRFPLQLLSPPSPHFLNSTFVEVDSLRRSAVEPQLEISAADASARGVQHGDLVNVFNDRGSFVARALVGDNVRPGVVVAPSIWWNKHSLGNRNCNSTTPTRLTDLGGGATFFDNLVEVERLSNEPEALDLKVRYCSSAPKGQP